MKFFSGRKRPFHLGPFPLEKLARATGDPKAPEISPPPVLVADDHAESSIAHAIHRFLAMMDTISDGEVAPIKAEIPHCAVERARHLKAACYYFDASMVGICRLRPHHFLREPRRNAQIDDIRTELEAGQPKTYAAGVDAIYADILEAAGKDFGGIGDHQSVLLVAVEHTREPSAGERGCDWINGVQAERAALLTANTAVVIASYLRMLGFRARSHTATSTEVDFNALAVSAGLCVAENGRAVNPFVGDRLGFAAVTTTMELECDEPLRPDARRAFLRRHGAGWMMGHGADRRARTATPFSRREFRLGPHPFESLKRVDEPTTFIDHKRVPRFPRRADFFARSVFGDLGKAVQNSAKGGHYVVKSPIGACARRALGALLLLQFGEARCPVPQGGEDAARNGDNVRAACYFLATDAVGISAVPDWAYYSHDAGGNPLRPYHSNGISMLFDQGFDTMEGASGDDWISVAQSMRAYLRFSLIGGVVAEQIRRRGYSARVHSVLDSEVLQPPLLLLSGLGEVSRIGEVILNPFLGPRLKAGTVTTSMPLTHDRPVDFGLQKFCESCNKCARECPSGAITAGPKLMYNGYEIWKSDAEKCTRYRITNSAGGMCGRCMKTCPWNLEGLFAEAPFRWVAMNLPALAKPLAKLDDLVGRGKINPVKKWWWDIKLDRKSGRYVAAEQTNSRELQTSLKLKYEDQTLAVYPADLMPLPFPIVQPLDREEGIKRYAQLLTPGEYRRRLEMGDTVGLVPQARELRGPPPTLAVKVARRIQHSERIASFELIPVKGGELPEFDAGAHVDVVIAPEYQRQFSLAGSPSDRSRYLLGVQHELGGRGGSSLMFKIFREGRLTAISRPRNHFPLDEDASMSLLFAGGIGVTPLVSMAHRLHEVGRDFLLHYSARESTGIAFEREIRLSPWAGRVRFHISDRGGRADFAEQVPGYRRGMRLYACGSERYMQAVYAAARSKGWPEHRMAREFFSVPEPPERENLPFVLTLARAGREVHVPAELTAVEALAAAGVYVDTKCTDGICGVCEARYLSGNVDHRDYVLAAKERGHKLLLCCSRGATDGERIVIDL
ncbi:MAG: 4Fe-4S dicluster domain-containing protein [Rhodobacteraceae bacterium]|nr:4Fe-4S dicluster domain-containing protein [Paracoccaceae bacterium]